ncbi:hypothetical protein DNTS_023473 [Danionella cerebrum]|uniref:THD domain-containing protein n=1 Tax=Danionella cerebrum TaxID=2873325 RepID=A0A553MWJ0_9TELE|nr:hypothetical protein DNTS_023473 [Danionella translucida]
MAPGKVSYPSVFVVDGHMEPPPLPPKPGRRQQQTRIQNLLIFLVFLALFGIAVEACFILHLYSEKERPAPENVPQTAMRKQEKEITLPKQRPLGEMKPSKPMAHLTTGLKVVNGVVLWHENHDAFLHQVKHKSDEGKLITEKEGFYAVYSKINYKETSNTFTHSVLWKTHRFPHEDRLLLESSSLHPKSFKHETTENSFIAGVFHLYEGDAIFVKVKNCSLVLSNSAENYFGMYWI